MSEQGFTPIEPPATPLELFTRIRDAANAIAQELVINGVLNIEARPMEIGEVLYLAGLFGQQLEQQGFIPQVVDSDKELQELQALQDHSLKIMDKPKDPVELFDRIVRLARNLRKHAQKRSELSDTDRDMIQELCFLFASLVQMTGARFTIEEL